MRGAGLLSQRRALCHEVDVEHIPDLAAGHLPGAPVTPMLWYEP
jgi:hypothetical protein